MYVLLCIDTVQTQRQYQKQPASNYTVLDTTVQSQVLCMYRYRCALKAEAVTLMAAIRPLHIIDHELRTVTPRL